MFTNFRQRARSQEGFTLIELLVVILIIGILAAIALPAFLGQRAKGQDSSAKSNVRNAVSQLESCFAVAQSYSGCDLSKGGLNVGTGRQQVNLTSGDENGFVVIAKSQSDNTFTITKSTATGGKSVRSCSSAGTADGGCNGSSW